MKKSIAAILMTTMILLSFLGTILLVQNVAAADATYHIKNGVLSSDDYSLYPYANKSIDMGMSKYGEMISETAGGVSIGLQYPGLEVVGTYDQTLGTSRDPFANDGVSKKLWLNGWLMEIRYTHRTYRDRTILAMAMFGDMAGYGGDWLNGFNASKVNGLAAAPHGGRKCTGYATSDPVAQLYDGPRSCVALSVTHIFDWSDDNGNGVVDYPAETWPVLDLRITYIFDKVKKEVIILKDIKLLMSGKELGSPVDVQFGDREEWDLGPAPEWPAYAHFYTDQLTTSYGSDWSMAQGILREYQYRGPGDIAGVAVTDSRDPYGPPIAAGSVRVYVNGAFKEEGLDYDIDYTTGAITWHIAAPTHTDLLKVIYKLYKYTDMTLEHRLTGVPNVYDVAQIISADGYPDNLAPQYVGWKAFWPVLSDYTVDGWIDSLTPLNNVSQPDFVTKEPDIPFIIGEWDFILGKGYPIQFRGVEVVGITDFHDASDAQMAKGAPNILDREVMYQLNEVFNPWDLLQAVEKKNARWVEFTNYINVLIDPNWITTYGSTDAPVIVSPYRPWYVTLNPTSPPAYIKLNGTGDDWMPNATEWDQYGTFSERIENVTDGRLLQRYYDYDIVQLPDGQANITFYYSGHYKILYSTTPNALDALVPDGSTAGKRYEWITVGRDASSVDSAGAALVAAAFKDKGVEIGLGGLDMKSATYNLLIPYLLNKFGTGDTLQNYFLTPDQSNPGQRLAFMDDWCTYWPIASSDMIAVGGPLANQVTMYYNDFLNAIYGTPWFTPYAPWSGKIDAPTCWAKNAYANSGGQNGTGYATIGTYLDINGTVGFDVWGLDGRDTYYATYWLNGDPARGIMPGIVQLQEAPKGLTSIILKISYTDAKHPVFSIVECLGTISETKWVHGLETKGGLHDP